MFARFDILDFIDLGGDLNIKVTLDNSEDEFDDPIPPGLHQEVYVCISKDRQPKLVKGRFFRLAMLHIKNNELDR